MIDTNIKTPLTKQTVDHTENVIEVKNVSFSYGGQVVLKDINLNVHRGDYIGLVGGNGSGKTTLVKIILGLLQPQSGSIRLFGEDIKKFTGWPKIGYVPQKAVNFDSGFPATVNEVVLMGRFGKRGLFHRLKEEDYTQTKKALEIVGMLSHKDRLIGSLSGGEQQRVFIARALATEPEIVFLDEPTVGVEKNVKDEFYELLRKLNREMHLTIILVTHDIESIAHEAMHVACIDKKLFFHQSVEGFLKKTHTVTHTHN